MPLPGTLGETYLTEHRGLHIGDLDHAVRYHPVHRMVVALMTDAISNEPFGVHRTFLDADGKKRERKMLGRQGVVRVSPDEEVTHGLGIAEGVEDAIAILTVGWAPVWAATSSGAIERFPVLPGIESDHFCRYRRPRLACSRSLRRPMGCRWARGPHFTALRNIFMKDWNEAYNGRRYSRLCRSGKAVHPKLNGAAGRGDKNGGPHPVMRCTADIQPEPIDWIWEGRIARGKLTVIGGDPEEGKSQIGVYISATISKGGLWPNHEGRAPLGSVHHHVGRRRC